MGASINTKGNVKSEPNVVPMIDVMLVLLIIFMIVTPVISSGFQAQIPQGRNIESRPEEPEDILLGIDRDGNYYLGTQDERGTQQISPIQADRLEEALKSLYATRTKDKILFFRADANLEFRHIEGAIQIARRAGVRVLATITEESREGMLGGGRRGGN